MDNADLAIAGIRRIPKTLVNDDRGRFEKFFSESGGMDPLDLIWRESFSSVSAPGTIRGLHLQSPPFDHYRLVSCTEGRVRDVCIDLRLGSPTYRSIHFEELSDSSTHSILVPPGVAHGFAVVSGPARLVYFSTASYSPGHDIGIRWSSIDFEWGIGDPVVSARDQNLPLIGDFVSPFKYKEEK